MDEEEKKKIVDDANQTIDEISNNLNIDGSKAKNYINKMDDNDLKVIRELGEIIEAFKKHKSFWKFVLVILVIGVCLNLFYGIGVVFGKFLSSIL